MRTHARGPRRAAADVIDRSCRPSLVVENVIGNQIRPVSQPVPFERFLGDRYQVQRELGRGGMATVYLARDTKHGREVAIKVIHPALAVAIGTERFLREIQLAGQLQHPHLVGLIDSGETEEVAPRPFYVMPLVEGESLRARLEREGQLPVADALRLIREIGDALHYAHGRGVIHRDIKPENVLLAHGHAMVTDFGIARAVREAGGDRLTATGVSLGTPAYMSPEQAGGSEAVDARSDQYSLACLLYEMLAGQPPFTGKSGAQVMARQVMDPVPPLATVRPGVTASVTKAVERALAKSPADRFADVSLFLTGLEAVEAGPAANPSIVVLPFANTSPDPDTDYFADGLTEEVIADLSNVRALKVIARNSAMRLKGTDKDARTLGRELDVRYVLAGSVRRAGQQLRITAQLAEAAENQQIWAGKFAGTVEDVFDLQERLAREIVEALKLTLTPAEDQRLGQQSYPSVAVFDCYYRARQAANRWTREGFSEAIEILRRGIENLGESDLLLSILGSVWVWTTAFGWPVAASLSKAERCVATIYARWPQSPYGDSLNAVLQFRRGNLRAATEAGERARRLLPHDADVLLGLCGGYCLAGRTVEARRCALQAIEIDPLSAINAVMLGITWWWEGDFDQGVAVLREGAAVAPENGVCQGYLALVLLSAGRPDEAALAFEALASRFATELFATIFRLVWLAHQGREATVRSGFTAEIREAAGGDETSAYAAAAAFALIGDDDEALRWFEHMIRVRGLIAWPYFAHHDPFLSRFRGDPRYEALLAEMKAKYEAFDRGEISVQS